MIKVIENFQVEQTLLKLIKEQEPYQKGKSVVSASDIFHLMDKRFLLVKDELIPLYEALSEDISVNNIYFNKVSGEEMTIVVQYELDGDKKEMVISQDYIGEITIPQGKEYRKHLYLIEKNQRVINETFEGIFRYNFDQHLEIPTTTRLFKVSSDFDGKAVYDLSKRHLVMTFPYQDGEGKIVCKIPKLLEYLNNGNADELANRFLVYEENIPSYLKKLK